MTNPSAKVIAHSEFEYNQLITLEIELHRFILPEFNTHRSISRNFQSSRAVPVKQMIEQVMYNPAIPVHWGKNEPGMVANEQVSEGMLQAAKECWFKTAKDAARRAEIFSEMGLHKQLVNRILEPYMWTKGVATATIEDWQAFLKLRLHKDAQPEIKALAIEIDTVIKNSSIAQISEGDWHMPYFGDGYYLKGCGIDAEEAVMISASCTGQVSYRKLDDSLEKAKKIYDMLNLPSEGLYPENPPHFSPTEHQVMFERGSCKSLSGNFHKEGFIQYRKALEFGIEKELLEK